jgi:IS30 family transposase
MSYTQLTPEDRYTISALRKEGLSNPEIAKRIGRHRSTISREFKRHVRDRNSYRPNRAIWMANGRRSRSRRGTHFSEQQVQLITQHLLEGWSPEQVAGRFKEERVLVTSHETIYRLVRKDKYYGGELYKALRGARKLRRKWRNSVDNRGRLVGKRNISERPLSVEQRNIVGHWEVDTVVEKGSKHCIVTLVERATGYAFIGKLLDRSKICMSSHLTRLISGAPEMFKTITSDNGTEFHDYESVEKSTGVEFYFTNPYHSWERGSNENFNGLVRQFIPKGFDQSTLTQRDCDAIAHKLNPRPRKRLNY